MYYELARERGSLADEELRAGLVSALDRLGPRKRVLAVPPDITRLHSRAGRITELVWEYYGPRLADVLPATGTHLPMSDPEIASMYGAVPRSLFRVHRFRKDVETLGRVPAALIREVSEGRLD